MGERKSISKKIRFEVFKRDNFTCQYCGAKSPDVVLHVDHFIPVAMDGTNDIWNLKTSCEICNSGKRDQLIEAIVVKPWIFSAIGMRLIQGNLMCKMEAIEVESKRRYSLESFLKNKGNDAVKDALRATHGKILYSNKKYTFTHNLTGNGVFGIAGRSLDIDVDEDFQEILNDLGSAIFESIPPFGPDEGEFDIAEEVGKSFFNFMSPGSVFCLCMGDPGMAVDSNKMVD